MDELDLQAERVASRMVDKDYCDPRLLHDLAELAVDVIRDLRHQYQVTTYGPPILQMGLHRGDAGVRHYM